MDTELAVETARVKLKAMIAGQTGKIPQFSYGFLVHRRVEGGRVRFGIITSGGESLALTRALVRGLAGVECWIYGVVPARLRLGSPGLGTDGLESTATRGLEAPAARLVITRLARRGYGRPDKRLWPLEGLLTPANLNEPLLVLTRARPPVWPQ